MNTQYTFTFRCHDNGGKHQTFKVKASDKPEAIRKGLLKADKHSAGEIRGWECKLDPFAR